MQLHELHPSLVHLPIALLPATLAADVLDWTSVPGLAEAGRREMALTAGTAALSAVTVLVAQKEVAVEGKAHDLLVTHRTLNLSLVGLTTAMAFYRTGLGYLATGLLGLGVTVYSAYLGGEMVYTHGVGVAPAGGLREDHPPPQGSADVGHLLVRAGHNIHHGLRHTLEHFRRGEVAPTLTSEGGDGTGS